MPYDRVQPSVSPSGHVLRKKNSKPPAIPGACVRLYWPAYSSTAARRPGAARFFVPAEALLPLLALVLLLL